MLDFEVARWYKLHRWACWTEPTLSAPDHSNHPSVDTQDVSDHPDMSPSTESPVSDVLENAEEPHTFESNWESSLQVPDKSSFLDSPNKSQETCLQKQHNNMTCPSNLHLHKSLNNPIAQGEMHISGGSTSAENSSPDTENQSPNLMWSFSTWWTSVEVEFSMHAWGKRWQKRDPTTRIYCNHRW